MHIIVLRDADTGEVIKVFNVEDVLRVIEYLDADAPGLEAYEVVSTSANAPLMFRKICVDESSRVTEPRTISADFEGVN